ncbi:MAG: nickel pincer cofactor biosynthesis protein LarB [Ignavibacteriales bacterium]|nr:nickel pincer cofactor biosynthesis protein LarB [Ignavibacteriales bacterium]
MQEATLRKLLREFREDKISEDTFLQKIKTLPFEDFDFVKLDHHRALRKGFPEVIYGAGKLPSDLQLIVKKMLAKKLPVMITRVAKEHITALRKIPDFQLHEKANIISFNCSTERSRKGKIVVVSAGTSDIPVAEEAVVTAELLGSSVERLYDVGVAGIHRLLMRLEIFENARCIICVAGMEGALASVVGGIVSCPVIAVPTSVGYGASFNGIAALLTMLNSCATGISVVNIDNGFGAGYQAHLINTL